MARCSSVSMSRGGAVMYSGYVTAPLATIAATQYAATHDLLLTAIHARAPRGD